jgi:hypothetical protein
MARLFLAGMCVLTTMLTACASTTSSGRATASGRTTTAGTSTHATSQAATAATLSGRQECSAALGSDTVLGWGSTTAAGLRSYRYAGPIGHLPLRKAFGTAPGSTPGLWCVVKSGPHSDNYFGVVKGYPAVRALGLSGPGEGRFLGARASAPIVP